MAEGVKLRAIVGAFVGILVGVLVGDFVGVFLSVFAGTKVAVIVTSLALFEEEKESTPGTLVEIWRERFMKTVGVLVTYKAKFGLIAVSITLTKFRRYKALSSP